MENPAHSIQLLTSVETLAQEILTDRSEVIALDKRRNGNREALSGLKKVDKEKSWFALGPVLVKMPKSKIKVLIEKDQTEVTSAINKIRSDLKVKVNKLRDLEYQEPVPGLNLNPLSPEEFRAVSQALGGLTY